MAAVAVFEIVIVVIPLAGVVWLVTSCSCRSVPLRSTMVIVTVASVRSTALPAWSVIVSIVVNVSPCRMVNFVDINHKDVGQG